MNHANRTLFTPAGSMSPMMAAVLSYWQGQRRGDAVPARADINPAALQPWLSGIGMLERGVSGEIRFRLGGRTLTALLGTDARGLPLRALFAPEVRAQGHRLATAAFEGPQILTMGMWSLKPAQGAASQTQLTLSAQFALLPLTDASGTVNRAILCLDHDPKQPLERYCRFHMRHAVLTPVTAQPHGQPVPVVERAAPVLRVITGGLA
jgi:hypothetical protein